MSRTALILTLLTSSACAGDDPPAQTVPVDAIEDDLRARLAVDLGFAPDDLPDPPTPPQLLEDPHAGPVLQAALDRIEELRRRLDLELDPPASLPRELPLGSASQALRSFGASCEPWSEETTHVGETLERVRTTRCGAMTITYRYFVLGAGGWSNELVFDGVATNGDVYVAYTALRSEVVVGEDTTTVTFSAEQRPSDPGPWFVSTIEYPRSEVALTTTWRITDYSFDSIEGRFRPNSDTFWTSSDADHSILVWIWSFELRELYLWLTYVMPADGPCEKTELDPTGAIVAVGAC